MGWKCVTDAVNKESQLRRHFNDVRNLDLSSIMNISILPNIYLTFR